MYNEPPPDETCLILCNGSYNLCKQKVSGYTECKKCPRVKLTTEIRKYPNYDGSIPSSRDSYGYKMSDDPTKCQLDKKETIKYRFDHADDDAYYVYAYRTMQQEPHSKTSEYVGPRAVDTAIRVLISKSEQEIKTKELTAKILYTPTFDWIKTFYFNATEPLKSVAVYEYDSDTKMKLEFTPYIYSDTGPLDDEGRISVWLADNLGPTTEVTRSPSQPYLLFFPVSDTKLWHTGIQVGMPLESNEDISDSYLARISFAHEGYTYTFRGDMGPRGRVRILPERIREKYFPEDIE